MGDKRLFEVLLVSCQALLFKCVDELELVGFEFPNIGWHMLFKEILKVLDVLSNHGSPLGKFK